MALKFKLDKSAYDELSDDMKSNYEKYAQADGTDE